MGFRGSRSGHASATESPDRTVGLSRASAVLSIDPDVLRETSGGRRRRPELNPGILMGVLRHLNQ